METGQSAGRYPLRGDPEFGRETGLSFFSDSPTGKKNVGAQVITTPEIRFRWALFRCKSEAYFTLTNFVFQVRRTSSSSLAWRSFTHGA